MSSQVNKIMKLVMEHGKSRNSVYEVYIISFGYVVKKDNEKVLWRTATCILKVFFQY